MWRLQIDFIMGSLDTICGDRRYTKVSLCTCVSMCVHVFTKSCDCLSLPCPVSPQKHHCYVDCAAEPGKLCPGVSEPFGLLLARVDLQERKYQPLNIQFCLPLSSFKVVISTLTVYILCQLLIDTICCLH